MKKRCAFFTNIAPLYSRPLWYALSSSEKIEYTFFSSKEGFSGIKTIDFSESGSFNAEGKLNWRFLKNYFIRKNIIFFQSGIISQCLRTDFDAYILYGEMHCISNWIAAIICRLRGKPLLFLGHGLYGDEKNLKKGLRLLYYKIAGYHLVYGNRSRKLMIASGFKDERVYTVYNSLDFKTHSKHYKERSADELENLKAVLFPKNHALPVVMFIGRLTREKKVSILIKAISLSGEKGHKYNCLIIGGGECMKELQEMAGSLGIMDQVCFYGPVYDESLNSKFIMLSECCVSPGNVGLTAIHSLSLGTPVITHGNFFNQGPEAEAVIPDKTGLFFEENNESNLSDAIDEMIVGKMKSSMESYCIEEVKRSWNPQRQAQIFEEAIMASINKN